MAHGQGLENNQPKDVLDAALGGNMIGLQSFMREAFKVGSRPFDALQGMAGAGDALAKFDVSSKPEIV